MASGNGSIIGTVLLVGVVAAGAVFALRASHDFSKDRIAANDRARLVASLNSVLDANIRSHDLNTVRLAVTDRVLLGTATPIDVFIVTETGQPVASVFASVAPDGYNAPISLLIGIADDGTLTGVRAVSHRETRGLGDGIDATKTRWILQFDGLSLAARPDAEWAVDKDDGKFDSLTGATVTSRAVVKAVKNTLLYFQQHRDELFDRAARAARPDDADSQ